MLEDSIICSPTPDFPFYIAAKRYYSQPARRVHTEQQAITLILLHSTSFHKEIWEPTIAVLFDLLKDSSAVTITEAYAIDCPNHGISAVLNETFLKNHEFSCQKYAEAVYHFFKHAGVDFSQKNLVSVGHSLGGVASAIFYTLQPMFKFTTMILIEPMFSKGKYLDNSRARLVKMAYERKDVWPSRKDALTSFKRVGWHPKVVELFVKYGIRDHPTSTYEIAPYKGVTLACTRDQEAIMYRDEHGATRPVVNLRKACSEVPVHVVWGENGDYVPKEVQETLNDPIGGCAFASVTRMAKCRHLIPQHNPEELALVLFRILTQRPSTFPDPRSCSKL